MPGTDELQPLVHMTPPPSEGELGELRELLAPCMQCGTCTASCPNARAMDLTPRQLWRRVQLGLMDEVFDSRTFWYCSACYTCTLRCPRGVPVTRIMSALKRMSVRLAPKLHRCNQTFYSSFVGNVKKYGRVQETALMLRYFLAMKSLRLPLEFTSLGVKLAARGKVSWPHRDHRGVLKDLFAAVEEQNRRRHGGDAT